MEASLEFEYSISIELESMLSYLISSIFWPNILYKLKLKGEFPILLINILVFLEKGLGKIFRIGVSLFTCKLSKSLLYFST